MTNTNSVKPNVMFSATLEYGNLALHSCFFVSDGKLHTT